MIAPAAVPRWAPQHLDWQRFPKVTLHDHLDGSLRPETLIELADEQRRALPHRDPETLAKWFAGEVREPAVTDWDQKFVLTTSLMQTEAALVRVAREWVHEAAADGVRYGEVRWAPEKHVSEGLPLAVAVESVAEGLRLGEQDVRASGRRIRARQLLCGMRTSSLSPEIARLTIDSAADPALLVAGFDIAGYEWNAPIREHAAAVRSVLEAGIPVTLHAGEADGAFSVWEAVHVAGALRLGHGVRILEDVRLNGRPLVTRTAVATVAAARAAGTAELRPGRIAQWVIDRGIPLEVCVSSNSGGGVVSGVEHHPIDLLRELGFTVTVNPDNRLLSRTSLTREFALIAEHFGWGVDRFAAAESAAVDAAFLRHDEKLGLRSEMDDALAAAGAR